MNPTDLGSALLYGIPLVICAGMYGGFDSLLSRRECSSEAGSASCPKGERWGGVVARNGDGTLRISVAKSPEQLAAASDLVRERYAWRGYHPQDPGEVHADSPHERSSQEITFLVAAASATVGTLTLGLDGPQGLRAEAAHGGVIDRLRVEGRTVCELTRLALAEQTDSKAVLASLFSFAHVVGRTIHDVTDVFIEVNPRQVSFYSRVLGFALAAGETFCERVSAPSVLLQLELEALEERLGLLGLTPQKRPLVARAA